MTDSMNFGPDWIRNLSSEGSTGGGTTGGVKYQLAEYRYGREEMLALFDKNTKPPPSLTNFKYLYSEQTLVPLALLPTTDEEQRPWPARPSTLSSHPGKGRGGSLERGGRIARGRGYQGYGRSYDIDPADWSPRKEYATRTPSMENWRRSRSGDPEEEGWRSVTGTGRSGTHEKWGRSTSWRGEGDLEDKSGPPERNSRSAWGDLNRAPPGRRSWDNEDHLPEWANENPTDGGGSFDDKGAFHGSDDDLDIKPPIRREVGLQKSTSQQHISTKVQPPPLSISKSTMSLVKPEDSSKKKEDQYKEPENEVQEVKKEDISALEIKKSVPNIPEKIDKPTEPEKVKHESGPPKLMNMKLEMSNGPIPDSLKNEDSDFERLQEDLVLKLMGDEESHKPAPNNFEVGGIQPPPNLIPPVIQDKWFYQDPQGQMQGPFSNIEMAEWYKAGYFSNQLKVRRQCDERFFLLGELITLCGGVNPFTSGVRFPVLKNDVTKLPEDLIQLQYLQMAAYKQAQARILQEPWNALTLQQQELAAQRLIMQQQQVPQDLPFLQQQQTANPLMHMINQMQQANKLPGPGLVEKQPPNMPPALDPHLQLHMGNLLSMQNRLPTTNMTNSLPAGMSSNLTGTLPTETLSSTMPNLQSGLPLTSLQSGVPPVNMSVNLNLPRPTSHASVDQMSGTTQANDPISSLLKQLQQQKQQNQPVPPLDSLWQQNQFSIPAPSTVPPPHWQPQNEIPMSMWDVTHENANIPPVSSNKINEKQLATSSETQSQLNLAKIQKLEKEKDREKDKEKEKEARLKEENERRRRKELEEKQAKKEAEEKRKADLKKLEAEKRATEERKKKEEDRVRKELEKAKKEAEEKRLRELEEKRRLKEQRKAEEEARKRLEDVRKIEEDRIKNELKEAEARRQAEEKRLQQEQLRIAKAAPWSQSNSSLGLSLAEIQKAEREKRAQDAAMQLQRLQEKEIQQQQQQLQQERVGGLQLNWAKKPIEPRKVKSLAEIQAEEQERLAKQAAEARLQKEKESVPVLNNSSSIWSSQNLTWASTSTTNTQWSTSTGGFWDDSTTKQGTNKPSNVTKSNSTNSFNSVPKQQPQSQKQPTLKANKTRKEEATKNTNHNNNNNSPSMDEFTSWCFVSLAKMSTNIDIPTFITFLRDIESAFDVREYCKEYLGDSNTTHQFASSFLEKRRSFKPRNNAHKDDMCSPAPAITPSSLQHSTEFQEVKGKNKKNKKSKMLKVDSRILGFNVTSAPDRINVGDRDYGDNS